MRLIHLHNHTEYSLLDGASRIKDLAQKAKSFNMPAVAITDHGNLYGTIDFYKACKEVDIKPIIGCEVYITNNRLKKGDRRHLTLLAKDELGYQNLIKLTSRAYTEGFYYKPRIDFALLKEHYKGIIAMSACIGGEIPKLILNNKLAEAEELAGKYKELLKDDFYLEIMEHGMQEEKIVNKELVRISKKLKIPIVATNDTHYINKEDAHIQDILLCVGTKKTLSDTDRFRFPNKEFYFKSPEEMKRIFSSLPEAILNTHEVAEKCNLKLKLGQSLLPRYNAEDAEDAETLLKVLTYKNLPKRLPHRTKAEMDRLNFELSVINSMGFADYFLIVQDIILWAKGQGIPMGPGRGSVAGSLVAYVLGITEINPLKYGLLFERFLNPARVSMPDIDIDCCHNRRDEIINYITHKYGQDHVAQIITFGTMATKAAIRDVGRVLGEPLHEIDRLAKKADSLEGLTDQSLQSVIDAAKKLEGTVRHTGIHAAGVIIGDRPLMDTIPLQVTDGAITTQFEMNNCEEVGLLKMDLLGLKTLTIIDHATKLANIDINNIPLNNKKVFNLLSKGQTIGIFQLESDGMQRIIKKLKPDSFEDLIAMVALYRPGPLGSGMVDDFIDCKHGDKEINYLHPLLEPILKETYGVILYQEQVMRIATDIAGFTLAEADLMRRSMGKKRPEELKAQRKKFINGAKNNNISEEIANTLFDLIDYFSGYGFNKSHSAAYALLSYQTAYLKAHYPAEFMTAVLSNTYEQNKLSLLINDCRSMGIQVVPPDINLSEEEFTLENKKIRFGLGAIKNLGDATLKILLNNRPYKNVYDLVYKAKATKSVIETLTYSGALLSFGNKKSIIEFLPNIMQAGKTAPDAMTLFGAVEDMLPDIPKLTEYDLEELLYLEKEYLGYYVSSHPLDAYSLPQHTKIAELKEGYSTIVGLVTRGKSGVKNGKHWSFITIEDYTGEMHALIFNKNITIQENKVYVFKGKIAIEDKPKMFVNKIIELKAC